MEFNLSFQTVRGIFPTMLKSCEEFCLSILLSDYFIIAL